MPKGLRLRSALDSGGSIIMAALLRISSTIGAGLLMFVISNGTRATEYPRAGILLSSNGLCVQQKAADGGENNPTAEDVARAFTQTITKLSNTQGQWSVMDAQCNPEQAHQRIWEFGEGDKGEFVFVYSDFKRLIQYAELKINDLKMFHIVYRLVGDKRAISAAEAAAKSWLETVERFDRYACEKNRERGGSLG
jgi:hypothetical protein